MGNKTTGEALMMLLQSRKFLLLVIDILASMILYFVSKYGGPYLDDVKFVIAALQPAVWIVIYAIARDNQTEATTRTAQMQLGLAAPPCSDDAKTK